MLLSHGTGGSAVQMAWLGMELARHGYIAVAVNHPGNNATEPYTAEGFALWWERATDLSEVLDGMLADATFGARIDARRVGAAGFSMGGYTVLELAGARTNQQAFLDACKAQPSQPTCHLPEMKDFGDNDRMMTGVRASSAESLARSGASYCDPRIRAVFAISPAVGQAFPAGSFRGVKIPVGLVVGASDPIAPAPVNAAMEQREIPGTQLTILPGGVAHYTFLDTCTAAGKAAIPVYCADEPGVDRDTVHAQVVEMAERFFDRELR